MDERIAARFWAKVDKSGPLGCWLWTAGRDGKGYGHLRVGSQRDGTRRYEPAHRLAYEATHGPVPDGLVLDHICRIRHCVNPDHLQPATNQENLLRGVTVGALNARKTHCKRGHEFTPENTYRVPPRPGLPDGGRDCRTCRRAAHARIRDGRRARGLTGAGKPRRPRQGAVARP